MHSDREMIKDNKIDYLDDECTIVIGTRCNGTYKLLYERHVRHELTNGHTVTELDYGSGRVLTFS